MEKAYQIICQKVCFTRFNNCTQIKHTTHISSQIKPKLMLLLSVMLFLLASSVTVFAQETSAAISTEPIVIDIDKAVEMSLKENLSIKSEKYALSEKKRSNDTRFNSLFPSLTLSSTLSNLNEVIVPANDYWNFGWQFNAQLALAANIYNGIKHLRETYALGLITYIDAENKLKRDVKKSFYSILLLEENIKLFKRNIETAEKSYRQADINFRNGLASELDRLQSRVTLENLKLDHDDAVISYNNTLLAFKEMLGLEHDTAVKIQGAIDPSLYKIDSAKLIPLSLNERLDLKQLEKQAIILDNDLSASKNSRFPSLILSWNKNMLFLDDPFGSFSADSEKWRDNGAFTVALSFSVDGFIPFFAKDTEIKNKRDKAEAAKLNFENAVRKADLEMRTIIANIKKSTEKLQALEANEKLAQRSYELASEGYNAGAIELLSLENSMNQLQRARLNILQEKYNYQAVILDLEYVINKSMEDLNG